MSGTTNNGQRLPVEFGDYSGTAGVVERRGVTEVAFPFPIRKLRGVTEGTIDGAPVTVTGIATSEVVPRMVVLTVTAVTPGE